MLENGDELHPNGDYTSELKGVSVAALYDERVHVIYPEGTRGVANQRFGDSLHVAD